MRLKWFCFSQWHHWDSDLSNEGGGEKRRRRIDEEEGLTAIGERKQWCRVRNVVQISRLVVVCAWFSLGFCFPVCFALLLSLND